MASSWGGLNDIIEEAKKRKEREDEEKKREAAAKEGRKALEEQRRQERESQNIRPTQPISRPQQPRPQQPSPYSSPPIDTGPQPFSSSQDEDSDRGRTRRSNIIQPIDPWSPPTIAPRQMAPSLSDRARGPYDAPNRPMVPTQAQGPQPVSPEIDRWRPLSQWGQPQQEPEGRPSRQQPSGYVEPQQQFSLTPQQQQQRQAMYAPPQQNQWGDYWQARQQELTGALNEWTSTPEYQMAQARTEQRRQNELPGVSQSMAEGFGMAGGLRNPVGALGGATLGGIIGGLNQTDWGREAVIRGQDAMDRLFEVPGMAISNAPISGVGASLSELVTPTVRGMLDTEGVFRPENRPQEPLNLFGWLANYTMAEVTKTQNLRKRVQAYVEMGNPQANLALRNLPSGEQAVQGTLDLLVNRYEQANQLEQQAVAIQGTDPNQAGQLFMRAQELRSMTNAEAVESYMNPLAEFAYGILLDPTNVMGPLIGLLGITPVAQATRRAGKLVDVTPGQAIARLRPTVGRGQDLTRAMAQGGKQAQQTFDEIISPFLSPGERVSNVPIVGWLGKRTPESRASLDTEQLWQGLTGILSGITNKSDVQIVLNTLVTAPGELVRGMGNLSQDAMQKLAGSDGLVKWGPGMVGQNDFVRRLPILSTVQDLLGNMRSLAGEGMVNPYEFFAELHGIVYDGARRANGGKQPTKLPFGASNVKVERLGQDSAILSYVDAQGKMIQRSVEMGLAEANRRVTEIQAALKPGGKGFLDYARIPSDIQRAIMSDLWLGTRPANALANALGAMTNLFASDSYTLLPNTRMQDYLGKKFGGIMPNLRLQESATGGSFSLRAGTEVGSGAVDKLAQLITRNPDNLASQGMRKLYGITYGDTEIKLPGGLAIPFGEGAFYTRAFYVPFMRTFNAGITESINNNLAPRLQQMEGMTPQLIQQVGDWVVSLAQNGGKVDVATGIRKLAGKPELKMTLKQLGVPPELLSPQAARQIEQFIMDAAPSQAGEVMREISKILAGERNPAASILNVAPQQPGIYDWTDVDMQQEAAWLADTLLREAKKAGMDPAQVQQQVTDLASNYVKDQAATYERLNGDLAGAPNTPDTWSIVMDFWQDVQNAKVQARGIVDEAGQRATQLQTPEAWQQKWQTTQQTYEGLRQQLQQLGEQSRTALQGVYNGTAYQPKHDWWETIEGYLGWDEEVLRQARTIDLGSPDAADMEKWQRVISANREYLDNSVYELFGSFQKYPSLQNFDIVRNGMQKVEYMGAQVRANLDVLLERLVAGEISKTAYARARNAAWNTYFDAGVEHNQHLGRAIVYNGLADQTTSGLKWTEGGTTWQLQEPSTTPGKWWARSEAGQKEEFSLAQTATEAGPFVVPKSVVDDYNRLAKNEAAIEAATDEVVREIVESAPETLRRTPPEPTPQPAAPTGPLRPDLMFAPMVDDPSDTRGFADWYSSRNKGPEYVDLFHATKDQSRLLQTGRFTESGSAIGLTKGEGAGTVFATPFEHTANGYLGWVEMIKGKGGDAPDPGLVVVRVRRGVGTVEGDEVRIHADELDNIVSIRPYEKRPPATSAPEVPQPTGPLRPDQMDPWGDEPVTMPRQGRGGLGGNIRDPQLPAPGRTPAPPRPRVQREEILSGEDANEVLRDLELTGNPYGDPPDDWVPSSDLAARDLPDNWAATSNEWPELPPRSIDAEYRVIDEGRSTPRLTTKQRRDEAAAAYEAGPEPADVEFMPSVTMPTPTATIPSNNELRAAARDAGIATATNDGRATDRHLLASLNARMGSNAKKLDDLTEAQRLAAVDVLAKRKTEAAAAPLEKRLTKKEMLAQYGEQLRAQGLTDAQLSKMSKAEVAKRIEAAPVTAAGNAPSFGAAPTRKATTENMFAEMSASEIVNATRDELLAAGLTQEDLVELATLPRRSVLDTIESIRGEAPSEPGMVAYDFEVRSVAQLLGFEPAESEIGKTIREWINRTRRTGNNTAPQMADIAQVQIRSLNDLERTLRARMPEILQGTPNQLNGAQRLAVVDAVMDWLPEFDNVLTKAQRVGDRMAGHMMLNYNDRRGIDTVLGLLTPYHYFWSRMPSRVLMGALSKPGLVNAYYEAKRGIALENEQSDVPDRLRGTLPMPGFLKDTPLGNARINVSGMIDKAIPAQGYLQPNPFVEEDPTDNVAEQWAKQLGKWTPGLFPTHEALLDLLDGKMDKYYGDVINEMLPIQPSTLYQRLTGQMPAQNGVMAKFGLGPDTADDGFGIDAYRARRAVSYIGVEEKLPEEIVKYADQVITNQNNGDPVEKDIPPDMLQQALDLAERGVKRAAEDRLAGRGSAFATTMAVSPYPQAEQDMRKAQAGYYASGYNAETNPYGSKELQGDIVDATQLPNWWAKSSETPGIDGQIGQLYDEAYATGDWDRINPKIAALKEQKAKQEAGGRPVPTMGPSVVPGKGPAQPIKGLNTKGMNPDEVAAAEQKAAANAHWDAYFELEDNAAKAKYLRDNPDFAEIYKQNIIDKGEEPEDWWTDYGAGGGGGGSAAGAHWDAYFELENNAAKAKYLRDNPDFAEIYKQNIIDKGEVPKDWWTNYGAGPGGGYGGGPGGSGEWGDYWDQYHSLENSAAKRQFLLDNPEFADEYLRYIREQDPEADAWWLNASAARSAFVPYSRAGNSPWLGGGGGGGGRGGSYTPPSNPPNIYAQEMSRELQNWRPLDRWWPQQGAGGSMDWQRAGDRIAPDPIRKWQPPRF